MNGPGAVPFHGPLVPQLSPQLRGYGPLRNSGTKSGPNATPPPKVGVAWPRPFELIYCNTDEIDQSENETPLPEPTDEELWLAGVARQVETDARPLFAALWIWLLHRALQADEEEPA